MDDFSSYPDGHRSDVCRLLLANPNYLPDSCIFSDEDDDPLGCPEITVRINSDWTVTSTVPWPIFQGIPETNTDDEEEQGNDYIEPFLDDLASISQKEVTSDEDEQIVPLSPTKSRKSTVDVQLPSLEKDLDSEGDDDEECDDKEETYYREERTNFGLEETEPIDEAEEEEQDDPEEESTERREQDDVPDDETVNRENVHEETGNRSNPQPP